MDRARKLRPSPSASSPRPTTRIGPTGTWRRPGRPLPTPNTTGDVPASRAVTNLGMTAAYSDVGSWRGPNTLKYRRETVDRRNVAVKARQYASPASFDTA